MDYLPQFGDNVPQDLSGIPADDSMMQLALKRKLALADALRQQEMPQGQMVSGHYVAPSWTQYAANLVNKYQGGKQAEEAMKQYGQSQTSKAQKLGELMKGKTTFETDAEGNQREVTKPYTNEELIGQLSSIDSAYAPKLFENYLSNREKQKTLHNVPVGGALIDESGKLVYQNPKEVKPVAAPHVQTFHENGYYVDKQWNPETQKYDVVSRSRIKQDGGGENKPPAGYRWGPNNTLEAIKGGPADINNKPLKEVPPTQKGAYIGNVTSISQIDDTLAKLDAAPDAWFGIKGGMGDKFMQTAYPESNDIRAAIGGVSSIKRHDISGAAVSPSEDRKLAQYIPNPTDDKKAIRDKLVNFKNELMRSNQAIQGSYGDEYSPLSKQQQASQPKSAMPAPRLGSGKINESSLKAGVIYDLGGGKSGAWNPKTRSFE